MHEIYTYPNSQSQFLRAAKVIPSGVYGHLGPAEGCFIPIEAYPLFGERAQGSYVWDIDGHRFIDYMCAYGPNILGYNDPDVDEAARKQREKGDCMTSPSTVMIDFAELLVDTVASADWAFFATHRTRLRVRQCLSPRLPYPHTAASSHHRGSAALGEGSQTP